MKRKILIALFIIIAIIVIAAITIYVLYKYDFSKQPKINIETTQAEQEMIDTLEYANPTENTNTIQDREFDGISYRNIQCYKEGDITIFMAEAYNVAKQFTEIEKKQVALLDDNGQELGTLNIVLESSNIGESTLVYGQTTSITNDISLVYDFIIR